MARIAGVDLPKNKRVEIGLTYIYGIGRKSADEILANTGVNPDIRVKDLSEDDVAKLRDYIDHNFMVRVTLEDTLLSTLRDLLKSAATEAFVTARVSP